jgi:hypothetical protein
MRNNDPIQKVSRIGEIPIAIEWPSGSERRRIASDDPVKMRADYGYIPGTIERSDGMEIDAYLGPNKESRKVFIITQLSRERQYDEPKYMLGYDTAAEAQDDYEYHIEKIPVKFGGIREESWEGMLEIISLSLKTPEVPTAEFRQNRGKQLYSNEIVDDEAVREGIEVEAEHKDLIVWLKAYLKEHGEFPPDETIYAQIAVRHLKESPTYYKELAEMENMNADEHREHTPIVSQQQADFFGAELGRKERGEKGQTDMSIEELKRHLREWGKKNELTDIQISKAYADAVNSGLRGNKAFATAAYNLGITTDQVFEARDRMLNPVTPEAKRDEGSRLYGSKGNK